MYSLRKRPQQRIRDVVEERRTGIEVREGSRLQLKPFSQEISINEVQHVTLGNGGQVKAAKVRKDLLRGLASRFVNECLWVRP